MRILFAPDSFKGSLTADAAAAALGAGWRSQDRSAELVPFPMADGGEGTLAAFAAAVPAAARIPVEVLGPDDRYHHAYWLRLPPAPDAPGGTGVVELASTSGIELLTAQRPWEAHSRGFGQAIAAALDAGVSRLILGIGSSSSTDGGIGMLTALGARILDATGADVPLGAQGLARVKQIDVSGLRPPVDTLVVTDVSHVLLGSAGAAHIFGPQKGLNGADIVRVDAALGSYARHWPATLANVPGSGAAGGVGFALLTWGARLVPGATEIGEILGLADAIARADLVVTGEGSYDGQSGAGKAPWHVSTLARRAGVPVALVAGRITPDADLSNFIATRSLTELAGDEARARTDAVAYLQQAGAQLAQAFTRESGSPRY